MSRYRGRRGRRGRSQAAGFMVLLGGATLADGLFAIEPLAIGVAVLASMVLVGGYLILRACA